MAIESVYESTFRTSGHGHQTGSLVKELRRKNIALENKILFQLDTHIIKKNVYLSQIIVPTFLLAGVILFVY